MSNKLVGPDFAYTDALNALTTEHLQEQRDSGAEYQKHPLRPSAAGHCTRELAFQLAEFRGLARYEKELNSPDLHRLFSLGHSVEYNILNEFRQHFKKIGFSLKYQQQSLSFVKLDSKVDPKFSTLIEGSIDFVLWSDNFKAIGDVKSKKEKFSSYRESTWDQDHDKFARMRTLQKIGEDAFYAEDAVAFLEELNDPFMASNVLQLNLYANNEFIKERGIDHCILIYYSKNTSRVRELRFKPSQELYDYVINKYKTAFDAVEQGDPMLAPREFNLGNIKCAFCPFNKHCWPEDDPRKTYFKTLPPKRWPKDTAKLGDAGVVLEELYEEYVAAENAQHDMIRIEQEMLDILTELEIDKVRFADGSIMDVKLYKSPKEHFKLKRGKL